MNVGVRMLRRGPLQLQSTHDRSRVVLGRSGRHYYEDVYEELRSVTNISMMLGRFDLWIAIGLRYN